MRVLESNKKAEVFEEAESCVVLPFQPPVIQPASADEPFAKAASESEPEPPTVAPVSAPRLPLEKIEEESRQTPSPPPEEIPWGDAAPVEEEKEKGASEPVENQEQPAPEPNPPSNPSQTQQQQLLASIAEENEEGPEPSCLETTVFMSDIGQNLFPQLKAFIFCYRAN